MASRTKKPVKSTSKKAKAKSTASSRTKAQPTTTARSKTTASAKASKKPVKKPIVRSAVKAKSKTVASKTARTTPKAKPAPKPKTAPKASIASKAKTVQKTKSASRPQPASRKIISGSKETLATLRSHIDTIEARLKRANSLTNSSVKAMQTAFTKLNERSGQAGAAQEKEIVEYVEALNTHLTGKIEKTREDVAHDLQVVLEDPRVETLSAALSKANHRITRAETEQAAALTSINEQIANLASVVDKRLRRETEAREQAQHLLSTKIDAVEQSSAQAVSGIGEKIVTLTEELNDRSDRRIVALKRELSETGLDQKKELEEHKSEVSRRIEALEDDQRNTVPSIERRLVTIVSRLESLEADRFEASNIAPVAAPAFAPVPQIAAFNEQAPLMTAPTNIDAFSPHQPIENETITPPQIVSMPTPEPPPALSELEAPVELAPSLDEEPRASHIPQEYVPQEYVAPQEIAAQQDYVAEQQEYAVAVGAPAYPQQPPGNAAYDYAAGGYELPHQQLAADPGAMAAAPPPPFASDIPLMPMPEQTMDEARPGGDPGPQKKAGLLSMIKGGSAASAFSGSPVKLFALMTGLAVIGLFAAQKLMPGSTTTPTANAPMQIATQEAGSPVASDPAFASAEPTPPVIESMDVVGDYSDAMQAPDIEPEENGQPSKQQVTLESAAADGDMIAQFQLGLSHLEAGRNAEAIRLIRLSANQGQPAAQYRLAKLYENGIGVEKDLPAAKKLLERSAKGGNRIAMHDLGHYFATGVAIDQPDIAKAVTWFQQAADRGVLDSQFNLGVLYQEGSGVTKNPVDAYVWYSIAGIQGDPMAVQRSEILARELSESQIEQGQARIKAYVPARINDAANGIFNNLPWAQPASTASARVNTDVKRAQELLSNLGFEVGAPDGAMGPKTRNAIISFERSNGLPETGRVSAELMDRLSLAAGV